jgi:hypothetical protein
LELFKICIGIQVERKEGKEKKVIIAHDLKRKEIIVKMRMQKKKMGKKVMDFLKELRNEVELKNGKGWDTKWKKGEKRDEYRLKKTRRKKSESNKCTLKLSHVGGEKGNNNFKY